MNKPERLRSASRAVLLSLVSLAPLAAQDAEKVTHTEDASKPRVSWEARGDGWLVRQYQLGCLSLLSYLLVSNGEAVVIDPQRDVEHYIADAAAEKATIRSVMLTHPHADFVAGHTELRHRTGATILLSQAAHAEFPHQPLKDGDKLRNGHFTIEVWETPGHTPNAMTFLASVPSAPVQPQWAFTGDTLFIGSIGRPDLLDTPPAELAKLSYGSIQRLKGLPDGTMVLPAHGAGSLCGAHLSPDTTSTIGAQKLTNSYLQIPSEASFIASVLSHQPAAPQYFRFNVEINRKGPPVVERVEAMPPAVDAATLNASVQAGGWVVDLRDHAEYAAGHIRGAINIALRGRLDTWTGIAIPFDAKIHLVGSADEVREGAFRLRRIGLDTVAGWLQGGMAAWEQAGLPVQKSKLLAPRDLHALMQAGKEPLVVDVRTNGEFEDMRLGDVGNIPVTESPRFAQMLDKSQPVLMVCASAYRSMMAVGLAERLGFADVGSLEGGLDAWVEQGLPVRGRMVQQAEGIAMPAAIVATQLAHQLRTDPSKLVLLDIRLGWQFADWAVPGSRNVKLEDVEAAIDGAPAGAQVVLLDHDGSHAFAAAGALMARKPGRVLHALVGGVTGWYREVELGTGASMSVPAAQPSAAAPAATPAKATKKRSAGC